MKVFSDLTTLLVVGGETEGLDFDRSVELLHLDSGKMCASSIPEFPNDREGAFALTNNRGEPTICGGVGADIPAPENRQEFLRRCGGGEA